MFISKRFIENDSLADNDEFDLLEKKSLGEVLAALNATTKKRRQRRGDGRRSCFASLFTMVNLTRSSSSTRSSKNKVKDIGFAASQSTKKTRKVKTSALPKLLLILIKNLQIKF
jgi:hypothetical protein